MGFASVVGGKTVFQDIAKFYQNTLDFALLQVSTGVLDVNSAARFAVKKMADSGIRYVDYASGHVNRVDAVSYTHLNTPMMRFGDIRIKGEDNGQAATSKAKKT